MVAVVVGWVSVGCEVDKRWLGDGREVDGVGGLLDESRPHT